MGGKNSSNSTTGDPHFTAIMNAPSDGDFDTHDLSSARQVDRPKRMMAMHTQYEGHECMLRDRQGAPNQESADTQVLAYPFDFLCKASALKLQTYREFQLEPAIGASSPVGTPFLCI